MGRRNVSVALPAPSDGVDLLDEFGCHLGQWLVGNCKRAMARNAEYYSSFIASCRDDRGFKPVLILAEF